MNEPNFEDLLRKALGTPTADAPPPPDWLFEDTLAALELCEQEANLALLDDTVDDLALPSNIRGATTLSDYTFRLARRDGSGLTIEIDVITDGESVLEGRVSPPSPGAVELISRLLNLSCPLDEYGRFNFDIVPRGTVRFAVQLSNERVITDWVVIQSRPR